MIQLTNDTLQALEILNQQKKVIVFQHISNHKIIKKEIEFDSFVSEKEINDIYKQWVLNYMDCHFTWYEKEI